MAGELTSVGQVTKGGQVHATWKRAYCAVLGTKTLPALAERTVEKITRKLREKGSPIPPVLLALIASDFLVKPEPEIDATLGTALGRLELEGDSGLFKVMLHPNLAPSRALPGQYLDGETSIEERLTRRGRFTYAHEFAHRFFFVPARQPGDWQRAVDKVTEAVGPEDTVSARRYIQDQEEVLCNTIARRILLPASELAEFVERETQRRQVDLVSCLGPLVNTLTEVFHVPAQSALLALGEAIRAGDVNCSPAVFAVYVEGHASGSTGAMPAGSMRIAGSIIGRRSPDRPSRRPFWRLSDVRGLGRALERECTDLLSARGSKEQRTVEIPMDIGSRSSPDVVCLKGWARSLAKGRAEGGYRSGLIWGELV